MDKNNTHHTNVVQQPLAGNYVTPPSFPPSFPCVYERHHFYEFLSTILLYNDANQNKKHTVNSL